LLRKNSTQQKTPPSFPKKETNGVVRNLPSRGKVVLTPAFARGEPVPLNDAEAATAGSMELQSRLETIAASERSRSAVHDSQLVLTVGRDDIRVGRSPHIITVSDATVVGAVVLGHLGRSFRMMVMMSWCSTPAAVVDHNRRLLAVAIRRIYSPRGQATPGEPRAHAEDESGDKCEPQQMLWFVFLLRSMSCGSYWCHGRRNSGSLWCRRRKNSGSLCRACTATTVSHGNLLSVIDCKRNSCKKNKKVGLVWI